jgi:hypothetical protein
MATLSDADVPRVGDLRCECGASYRFAAFERYRFVLWPQNGAASYRSVPLADSACVRCGADLGEHPQLVEALPAWSPFEKLRR